MEPAPDGGVGLTDAAPLGRPPQSSSSRSSSSPTGTTSAAWIVHSAGPPDSMTCSSSRWVSFAPHSSQRSPVVSSVFSSRSMARTLPLPGPREQPGEAVGVGGEERRARQRQGGHAPVQREAEHDDRDEREE